jgi:hypothetical protein
MQVLHLHEPVHPTCQPEPTPDNALARGLLSTILAGDSEAEALTAAEYDGRKPRQLAASALFYARMGWPVFPLRPVGTPCVGGDKCAVLCQCPKAPLEGSHGFKDATTRPEDVHRQWQRSPDHNVGLATGHLFDVVDIDVKDNGIASLHQLLDAGRLPDIHGIAVTASGGLHLYIKPTGSGNRAGWMPGVDHRGIGGYVVAPPSTLGPLGKSWMWLSLPSPEICG